MSEVVEVTGEVVEARPTTAVAALSAEEVVSPAAAYIATLGSELSRINVKSRLDGYAHFLGRADAWDVDWAAALDYQAILAYRLHLQHKPASSANQDQAEGMQVSSINCIMSALKGVAEVACNLRLISADTLRAIKSIKPLRGSRRPAGRCLGRGESRSLLDALDGSTAQGARDKAILALLLGCGLRRAEVTGIKLRDVDLDAATIILIGKGNKERKVFLTGETFALVLRWIKARGTAPGYLFGRFTKGGKTLMIDRPLSPVAVGNIVQSAWAGSGYAGDMGSLDVTPHDLRRTFATRLLEQNVDIVLVKNLMGHANVATTANYDRRGDAEMRAAAGRMTL